MKYKTIYCCEFCDKMEFDYKIDCQKHEASHFGISLDEYMTWKELNRKSANAGKACGTSNNPSTRAVFDESVEALVRFETSHQIEHMRKPTDFYY